MELCIIVESKRSQSLHKFLRREFKILKGKGFKVFLKEKPPGVFRCRMIESRLFGRRDRRAFKLAVANAMAIFVTTEWEQLLGAQLLKNASWIESQDWDVVRDKLTQERRFLLRCRKQIEKRAFKVLSESFLVNVEGFVRFRLQDITEKVGEEAANILDEHLLEQENRDFINVLKRFASQQQNDGLETAHVVIFPGNAFRIYDADYNILNSTVENAPGFIDDEIKYDDLLISHLVTLAPRKIIFHGEYGFSATLDTLKKVFGNAVSHCKGCSFCSMLIKA
ncbi:MAG: hypothetical protein H0Z39_09290 [Peptococcaceae bacterium]|nr:hypothetical protein [Peptococcaceae bacterium]